MKHFFFLFSLIAITMCAAPPLLAQDFRVVAIDDAPGRTMNAGIFSSADPEIVKKYMPDGGAPASVSSFVLFAGEDMILFDTALGGEAWQKGLTDLGIKPENVKLILITHFHGDHVGGLLRGDARRFPNAKVLVSTPEYDFYLTRERQPQGMQFGKIRTAYGQDFATFKFDDEVFANSLVTVKALDAVGHTPGHSAFLIESKQKDTEKMMILGDLLHAVALQFPAPEACASYDVDMEKAVAARKRILDRVAQEKIPVGGMHFPPPSIGTIEKNDQGGYEYHAQADR